MAWLSRKSITALQREASENTLRRTLGPADLTMLGIGAIIGTGIFVLTGTAAAQFAGPALVLSMIIAGVGCAFAGLCYAEFASMIPVAGSAYTYAYATLGEVFAWIIGWDLILEYGLSAATVAVGWSGYAVSLMDWLGMPLSPRFTAPPGAAVTLADGSIAHGIFNVPAFLIILAVSALLVVGIRESAVVNGVIVVVKVLVLVLFVAVGALYVNPANWHPFVPENTGSFGSFGWSGVLRGAGVIFFAYIGFDAVSTAAQEARRPQRDMPIGILASLAICTALFIAVSLVVTGLVHYGKLNVPNPIAVAIEASGARWLSPFISVGALAGISSVMIVVLLGQSRIFYSMSRDGFLPPVFRNVHPRFKTPYLSTMLTGIIVAVGAGATPIAVLSQLTSMGTLLAFVIVSLSVIVLRKTEPALPRPFRTPWVPWVPLLAAVICFGQMAALPWATWERLIIWLVIGGIIYLTYARRAEQRVAIQRTRADAA